jgi:tryptophanyl-tRNA synthetase
MLRANRLRVFSGVQPSGNLHLGNYLGAIRNWVLTQDEFENVFCVVDLHAITLPQDPDALRTKTCEVAMLYLACGISPQDCTIFVQSHVPAHSELAWILNCTAPMGWLARMTQYKDKSAKQREGVSVGLFNYPVLMAADILLYDTDFVPVGEDQKQHIELTRNLAIRFNRNYGQTFKIPEPKIGAVGARIMGLDDPTKKMSKSESNPNHALNLLDSPDVIRRKIARAVTDTSSDGIRFDESRPGIYNLLSIFQLLSGSSRPEIEQRYDGKGYSEFKRDLAELIIDHLRPVQHQYSAMRGDLTYIEGILAAGAERAATIAERTLHKVRQNIGLVNLSSDLGRIY